MNLTPVEPPARRRRKAGAAVLTYTAGGRADYGGAWQVHAGPPRVRVYTVAGRWPSGRLAFVAVVDVAPAFGGVEALDRPRPQLGRQRRDQGAEGGAAAPLRRGPDEWAWALEQDPGSPGRLRVVLAGEQPGEAAAGAVDAGGDRAGRGRGRAVGGGRRART